MTARWVLQAKAAAKEFALWRAAMRVGWNCTIAEAARDAGVDVHYAHNIAARKGWSDRFASDARIEISQQNGRRWAAVANRDEGSDALDVVDMMERFK